MSRGVNAQVPGPPRLSSSPILKVDPGERPGDLIAVVVRMEEACGAGRQGFLEHNDALAGLAAEELQVKERPGVGESRRFRSPGVQQSPSSLSCRCPP